MKKSYADFKGDFRYIVGQRFHLVINNDIAGEFEIVKLNPTRNTYLLANVDKSSNVKGLEVNHFVFDLKVNVGKVSEIDIYDFDELSSIKYRDEQENTFLR